MRITFTVASAFLVLASTYAQAQKIAVVDMQGAILQTKEGKQAGTELSTKFAPKEQDINKRTADLQAKQATYQKTAATMSDSARADAERDITALQKVLQRDTDDAKAEFSEEENRLLGGILQKMQAVMQKYALDNKISMIVDISTQPNNLLYADKSVNVTADLIALYDKAQPASAAPAATKPAAAAPKPPAAATSAPKSTAPATKPPAKP
jgi:outer membrane protein